MSPRNTKNERITNMKKLMVVTSALMLAAAAQAECRWSWWVGGPDKDAKIQGCQLGIASECKFATACFGNADKK